jgi:hypothetical protein
MRIYFTHAQNFHKPITYRTIRRLDWAPPALDDKLPWATLELEVNCPLTAALGPDAVALAKPEWVELVDELELVEQLPELPLTLDGEFVPSVLEELLQLNAIAIYGHVDTVLRRFIL